MTDLKQVARQIFHDTLGGVDISRTFERKVRRDGSRLAVEDVTLDLAAYRSIRAVAMGKASAAMARGLVERLAPDFPVEGVLAAPHDDLADVAGFRVIGAGHPIPDEGSAAAARAILDLLAAADVQTLILFLLSGGSSALVELPAQS